MQLKAPRRSSHTVASAAWPAFGRSAAARATLASRAPPSQRQVKCFGQWLEIGAEADVAVPRSFAFQLFDDRASIPKFMNWIKEVEVIDSTDSRWKLQQEAFGQVWNLSWLAKNQPPVKYQKIHWVTVPGSMKGSGGIEVENRGEVRFRKSAETACKVRIGVQFEVPEPLVPFAVLLVPFGNEVMSKDMKEFAKYAENIYANAKEAQKASVSVA